MSIPYNPFEPLDRLLLKEITTAGKHFLVIQQFNWPGVPDKKGFMVTPYKEEGPARLHFEKLAPKEGSLINLESETETVTALINHPQYLLFLNTFRDEDWASRTLKYYQRNIVTYLSANSTIRLDNKINIELIFKYGRLKAIIQSDGNSSEFDAYDLVI
jgi:hypothetical protein